MIRAVFYGSAGRFEGFECEGHSDHAERGYDIVCAAVSALLTNCVNAAEGLLGVKSAVRANAEVGYLSMRLPKGLTDEQASGCQLLIAAARMGLNDIAQQYPDDVRVTDKDRRS
jgi:hypothetical protein